MCLNMLKDSMKCSSVSSAFCGAEMTQQPVSVLSLLDLHVSARLYGQAAVTESLHS